MNITTVRNSFQRQLSRALLFVIAATSSYAADAAVASAPPKPGDLAPNFTLQTLDQRAVELDVLVKTQPVVLVVLRGWPGYQCPLCTRQVQEFIGRSAEFERRGVKIVMVYPGPAEKLQEYAGQFLRDKQWPASFVFVTDPDYRFTHAYGLRWDAPKETAYPSTFVIEQGGRVRFSHVSKTHGNRLSATRAIAELP